MQIFTKLAGLWNGRFCKTSMRGSSKLEKAYSDVISFEYRNIRLKFNEVICIYDFESSICMILFTCYVFVYLHVMWKYVVIYVCLVKNGKYADACCLIGRALTFCINTYEIIFADKMRIVIFGVFCMKLLFCF